MQVILLERIENLGQMGDVVTVKDGYARNFLLPRKKALRANDDNRARFEAQRKEIEARNLERRKDAEAVAKTLEGATCTIIRQAGEAGQLYGSVSVRDIAMAFSEAGYKIDRHQVVLNKPIKTIGIHTLKLSLHAEVQIEVTVNVARSLAEAEAQITKGDAFFESAEDAAEAFVTDEEDAEFDDVGAEDDAEV